MPGTDRPAPSAASRMSRALDHLAQGCLMVDADWTVGYANPRALAQLGARAETVVGRVLWDRFPDLAGSPVEGCLRTALAAATPQRLECALEDGRHVEIEAVPDGAGLVVYVDDIGERLRLERLARRDALILAATGEGIYGLDAGGRTTFVNPAAEQLLGYALDELVGVHQHEAVHHSRLDGSPFPADECPIHRSIARGVVHRAASDVFWRKDGRPLLVSYVATPIVEDDRVVGAVVAFDDISERVAAEEERERAESYRRRADELAAAEKALHELQQAMQPPVPELSDPELGVHYAPAHGAAAGGDLYDWQLLPDGTLHVAVVDVIGKGVPAAKDAIAVTHALRLLVLAEVALPDVVRQADALLGRAFPDLVATALVCRYHPDSGRLRVAGGGHPPPLVVAADGSSRFLDIDGRAVGWPLAGSDGVVDTTVEPGGTLVLYTDGLVEAQRDILRGMVELQQAAARLTALPAQRLAEALVVDTMANAERRDDTLCLVLRRAGAPE